MKKITHITIGTLVLSLFAFASVAFAQINANANVTGNVDDIVTTKVETNTDLDTSTTNDVFIPEEARVNAEAVANSEVNFVVDTEENNEDYEVAENSSRVEALLKTNANGIAVIASSQVDSEEDLEVFESNIPSQNKAVVKVNVDSEEDGSSEITVVYRHKGKFLGFLPITIKSTTVVEAGADSRVKVRSSAPWWGFLVSSKAYSNANVESRLENNATLNSNLDSNIKVRAQAEMVEAIIAELTAEAEANIETDTSI